MFNRVLAPLDGLPLAESALPRITQVARALGIEVVLVSVVTPASSLPIIGG